MIRRRKTKRYFGYGLVTDNVINMLKTAGKTLLSKGSTYLGDKIGNKIAKNLIPEQPKAVKSKPKQEDIFKELQLRATPAPAPATVPTTEEDFGL